MYKPSPISIQFIWHPEDKETVLPIIEYCKNNLSRKTEASFLHSLDFPLFYFTSTGNAVPKKINTMSEKSLVFAFVSDSIMADDKWINYIKEMSDLPNTKMISIVLSESGLKINSNINQIRYWEYIKENDSISKQMLFIDIAHEIYRWLLNENNEKLSLFISHTKKDSNGKKLAEDLRNFIHSGTKLGSFFDSNDIQTGEDFNEEIRNSIKRSTFVIIHSDSYSSRYWCQKEVMYAKENKRPIIEVNDIHDVEDRGFPPMCNYPSIRYNDNLLSILELALLETIRFYYCNKLMDMYKANGCIPGDAEIYCSVPDSYIIQDSKADTIVYPEPELYPIEKDLIYHNKTVRTPLSNSIKSIKEKKIGISISESPDEDLLIRGQDKDNLITLSKILAQKMLRSGATLVYGGDLRKDGFTQFLFEEANIVQDRIKSNDVLITNYVSWPAAQLESLELKSWTANYRGVCEFRRCKLPANCPNDLSNVCWSNCLSDMRKEMISQCDVRVCAGGKITEYKGAMPGLLEEIVLAARQSKPVYILGGFGGMSNRIADSLKNGSVSQELFFQWQKDNNKGYGDMISQSDQVYVQSCYSDIARLTIDDLHNGLSVEDNYRLFETPFIDEVICLITKGLEKVFA